jgi:thiol-disulfide isomerase/thioredoxin
MIPLESQEHFEELFRDPKSKGRSKNDLFIVYFTASWCQPCKNLDRSQITEFAEKNGIPFYICDAKENNYTPGYANVRGFPTFVAFTLGKEINRLQSNSTEAVLLWIDLVLN